jgi:hypothetical protein
MYATNDPAGHVRVYAPEVRHADDAASGPVVPDWLPLIALCPEHVVQAGEPAGAGGGVRPSR